MTTETTETTTPKASKGKGTNGATMPAVSDEQNTKLALALFNSIPEEERPAMLMQAQLVIVGKAAYKSIADAYYALTGEKLGDAIALDDDGFFSDAAGNGNIDDEDEDEDEDEDADTDEDEDAVDATAGEDEDEIEEDEPKVVSPTIAFKRLRKWMKDGDYTQAYVARKLKLTQPAVSHWFNKGGKPRAKLVPRILRLIET